LSCRMAHTRSTAYSKTKGPFAPSRNIRCRQSSAAKSAATSCTERTSRCRYDPSFFRRIGPGVLPGNVAGSTVQTKVFFLTSTMYRCDMVSKASRKSPLAPYIESAMIQSSFTFPAARVRRIISAAGRFLRLRLEVNLLGHAGLLAMLAIGGTLFGQEQLGV